MSPWLIPFSLLNPLGVVGVVVMLHRDGRVQAQPEETEQAERAERAEREAQA